MARTFVRGPRRKTQWGGFGSESATAVLPLPVTLSAGVAQVLSSGTTVDGAGGLLDEEITVVRTIGMLTAAIQTNTAGIVASFAAGCGVFRGEVLTAGVGSLPSPEDDPDFEWLAYFQSALTNPNSVLRDGPVSGIHLPFDIRSQRIIRKGESLAWIGESQNATITVGVNGRYLFKLP